MKAFWYNDDRKMYVASRYENFARKNIFPQKIRDYFYVLSDYVLCNNYKYH